MAWSPDGARLATASSDHPARVWSLVDADVLGATPADLLREAERRTGLRVVQLKLVDIAQEVAVYPENGLRAASPAASTPNHAR